MIFEGEGQVVVGIDPAVDGLPRGTTVLRIREGNYHAQVDVTGLTQTCDVDMAVEYEIPPLEWDPEPDPLTIPDPPRHVLTRLSFDIPASLALAMRQEIYQGHPDHRREWAPGDRLRLEDIVRHPADRTELSMSEVDRMVAAGGDWYREWMRILGTRSPSARLSLIRSLEENISLEPFRYDRDSLYDQGVITPEEARRIVGMDEAYEAREELIRSTRAEFPPDPYDYGRRCPSGPMRWTPPEDGEEVRSCP